MIHERNAYRTIGYPGGWSRTGLIVVKCSPGLGSLMVELPSDYLPKALGRWSTGSEKIPAVEMIAYRPYIAGRRYQVTNHNSHKDYEQEEQGQDREDFGKHRDSKQTGV